MLTKTDREDFLNYLTDASNMAGGSADVLLMPESTAEVSKILREANEAGVPVTIGGARTGTVGGAVPFGGRLVSMELMASMGPIDTDARKAVVGPAVVLSDFQKVAEAVGLFYPPDPTEWSCQLGGTVATNASGARSFKYGATREFVRRLEVVLADGDVLDLERGKHLSEDGHLEITTRSGRIIRVKTPTYPRPSVRKNVAGYMSGDAVDAIDLFIGSEGTLGVITEIELALIPKPAAFFSGITFFDNETALLRTVEEARRRSFESRSGSVQGIDATLLEYFDQNSLDFIKEKFPQIPDTATCALFFEQETTDDNDDLLLSEWNALLEENGADLSHSWFTTTEADREKMRSFRHALPVAVNERVVRNRQKKIGTDMAVPDEAFPAFLKFYRDLLGASGIEYVIFGHIGDCHLHANLLPKNEQEAARSRELYGRCIAQAIMLGGTVSAEHGIGKHKSKYLYVQYGERYLNEMAELKRTFDPKFILGRGNMIGDRFIQSARG